MSKSQMIGDKMSSKIANGQQITNKISHKITCIIVFSNMDYKLFAVKYDIGGESVSKESVMNE